jgi:hypothetical protein
MCVGEEVWLYVVEFAETAPRITRLNDPLSLVTKYVFDPGWRALGETDPVDLDGIVEAVREAGLPAPAARYVAYDDPDAVLDLAWPERQIAIVADETVTVPAGWLAWIPGHMELDALLEALGEHFSGVDH